MKKHNEFLLKSKDLIEKYSSKFIFSLGLAGLITLYITTFCSIKLNQYLKWSDHIYNIITSKNIEGPIYIEQFILIISIISIMAAPLLNKKFSKSFWKIFFFNFISFVEIISFVSIFIKGEINNLFIISTIITFTYLIWIIIDILKFIDKWIRIKKSSENQFDLVKLTFIWGMILFLIVFLK
ncbi:hypothetical protein I9Y33_002280 [Clostridium perfringens]|nr:hypothetical protein [Clostridium perfringens]EGT0014393.1 hypothetical protein [Clostridium perfringens]